MIVADSNGQGYSVRFFEKNQNGVFMAKWIHIDYNPQGAAGVAIGADYTNTEIEIWPRIIELAYLQYVGGAGNAVGGFPTYPYETITGRTAPPLYGSSNFPSPEQLISGIKEGKTFFIGTVIHPPIFGGLATGHQYRIKRHVMDNIFELENPWGNHNVTITHDNLKNSTSSWFSISN